LLPPIHISPTIHHVIGWKHFQKHEGIICFKKLSWSYGRGKEEKANNPSLKDPRSFQNDFEDGTLELYCSSGYCLQKILLSKFFTIDGLELETSAYSGQLRWAIDHPGYLLPFHGFFEVKWSTTYGLK
jgi:hypothetical protein